MLFLASFFPMGDIEEEEREHKFDLVQDFLRATVDLADLWYLPGYAASVREGPGQGPGGWPRMGLCRASSDQAGVSMGGCQGCRV